MRLIALLLTALAIAAPTQAQSGHPVLTERQPTAAEDGGNLPVSLDKIKEALQQQPPLISLSTVDNRPTFRVQIIERQRLDELMATLNFRTGPAPGGGLYGYEMQRQMFNPVQNPMMQPYAAFSGGELLTILFQNVLGRYLGGKAVNMVSDAVRARAERSAKEEVRRVVAEYCAGQPRGGAGIVICETESAAPK